MGLSVPLAPDYAIVAQLRNEDPASHCLGVRPGILTTDRQLGLPTTYRISIRVPRPTDAGR